MLSELKDVGEKFYLVVSVTIFAILSPGFLVVLYYKPSLIESVDIFKLLLASTSLTLPLAIITFLLVALPMAIAVDDEHTTEVAGIWAISAFITAVILYVALYAAYLLALPFRLFTYIVLGLDSAVAVLCVVAAVLVHRAIGRISK